MAVLCTKHCLLQSWRWTDWGWLLHRAALADLFQSLLMRKTAWQTLLLLHQHTHKLPYSHTYSTASVHLYSINPTLTLCLATLKETCRVFVGKVKTWICLYFVIVYLKAQRAGVHNQNKNEKWMCSSVWNVFWVVFSFFSSWICFYLFICKYSQTRCIWMRKPKIWAYWEMIYFIMYVLKKKQKTKKNMVYLMKISNMYCIEISILHIIIYSIKMALWKTSREFILIFCCYCILYCYCAIHQTHQWIQQKMCLLYVIVLDYCIIVSD